MTDMNMPITMTAAVLHAPNDLRVMDVPVPDLRPGEMYMKVGACGICGSDLRYLAGENPWAKHTLGEEYPNPPDMILGHEIGGMAIIDGSERKVSPLAFKTCGRCMFCRTGRSNLCPNTAHLGHGAGWTGQNPGGMAEYCPVWDTHLFELPDHVSVEEGTFLDGLGVAVNAVNRTHASAGSPVLVFGGGPIGLSIGQVAAARGAGPVVVVDVYDTPLECAREVGLGPCINVADAEAEAIEAELNAAGGGEGFHAIFDTTGQEASQRLQLSLLQPGGTLVAMAGVAEGLALTPSSLAGERCLTTCSNNFIGDFAAGLALLASGAVNVRPMITHTFSLDDALEAFATAQNKRETGAIKVVIKP